MKIPLFIVLVISLSGQSVQAIDPSRDYKTRPDQFGIAFEEHSIETSDGAILLAWHMKSQEETRRGWTIVIAGSDAGNMGYALPYAYFLLQEGFDVLTFDYRGFGESSDFDFRADYLYHTEYIQDLVAVLEWVKTSVKPEKIGILAFSMGTFVSTSAYVKSPFDLLIAESIIVDPVQVVDRLKQEKNHETYLPENYHSKASGFEDLEIPMLLFASKSDKITTLGDSKALVVKKEQRKLVVYDGPHLRGAATLGMDVYMQYIVEMIE